MQVGLMSWRAAKKKATSSAYRPIAQEVVVEENVEEIEPIYVKDDGEEEENEEYMKLMGRGGGRRLC